MKDTPILFTPENYAKSEQGSKVMTRRLQGLDFINKNPSMWLFEGVNIHGQYIFEDRRDCDEIPDENEDECVQLIKCPYGQVGDRLYVKEACIARANGEAFLYKRDFTTVEAAGIGGMYGGWKSPLFMPKKAARLWLELTAVRVERLNSTSYEDCLAEGIEVSELLTRYEPREKYAPLVLSMFRKLWESIHGKGSWDLNPWVWVLEYRKTPTHRGGGT